MEPRKADNQEEDRLMLLLEVQSLHTEKGKKIQENSAMGAEGVTDNFFFF